MVAYTVMLIPMSCLMIGCLCADYRCSQDVSSVDVVTARLADALAQIAKTHFKGNGPVCLFVPSVKEKCMILEIIERLLRHMPFYFSVVTVDDIQHGVSAEHKNLVVAPTKVKVLPKPNIYIIRTKEDHEEQSLQSVFKVLYSFESFNPGALFVLIKTTEECGNFSEHSVSSRYFADLWRRNCLTAVLLVYSECDLQLTVVSGNPFSKENPCRTPNPGGLRYDHFTPTDSRVTLNVSKPVVRDFNGCPFTAGIIPAPPFVVAKEVRTNNETRYDFVGGVEMEIKDMISEKFNLTVKLDVSNGYDISSLQRKFSNGTEVGIAADMKRHKIDFALGGVSPNYRTFYMFDFSPTFKFSSFSWYVTNANVAPRWQIIFKTLTLDVWVASAAFLVLVSVLYFVMELHNYKKRTTRKFTVSSITFIELLSVGLGLSATQKPKGCSKVLFFSWAAFGLHWSMAYSSTLFDMLRTPPLDKDILTIQDLKDSGLKVVSPPLYFHLFAGVSIDTVTRSVLSNNIDCMNLELCIKQFLAQRNMSLMDRSEHVDYSVNFKVSKIHKLSEDLISFGVSLMANKGNPLSLVMKEVVSQAFETGLVGKWETDTAWKFNFEKNTLESYSDDSSIPLSVTILQGAFLLLLVGLLVSLLVFLGELFMYRCKP